MCLTRARGRITSLYLLATLSYSPRWCWPPFLQGQYLPWEQCHLWFFWALVLVLINQCIFLFFYQIFIPVQVKWNCTWVLMGHSSFSMNRAKTFRKFSSLFRTLAVKENIFLLIISTNRSYLMNIPGSVICADISWTLVYTLNSQHVLLKDFRPATSLGRSPFSFFFLLFFPPDE